MYIFIIQRKPESFNKIRKQNKLYVLFAFISDIKCFLLGKSEIFIWNTNEILFSQRCTSDNTSCFDTIPLI